MENERASEHDVHSNPRKVLFPSIPASLILPDATLPSLSGVSSAGIRAAKTLRDILPSAARGTRLSMPKTENQPLGRLNERERAGSAL